MKIPTSFVAVQRRVFQQTQVRLFGHSEIDDGLGGITSKRGDLIGEIVVNLRPITNALTTGAAGLMVYRDMCMTTAAVPDILNVGDYAEVTGGKTYQLKGLMRFDSHVEATMVEVKL